MNKKMKDSGVEWIGELPENWRASKLKNAYGSRNAHYVAGSYPYVALENISSFSAQYVATETSQFYDLNGSKLALKGDVIFGKLRPYLAKAYLVNEDSCVSSEFAVFYPAKDSSSAFLKYLFLCPRYIEVINSSTDGTKMPRVNVDFLKNSVIPLPSVDEQEKIVKALDRKTSKIDSLISNQEKQIEKLKEYRQAIITKAVTKGLDSNAPMKDSGIESIGEVPFSWPVSRAKFYFDSLSKGAGISKEEVHSDGDIQCIRYGEIYSKYDISVFTTYSKTYENRIPSKVYLDYGDILFSATGELVEEIGKNIVYLGKEKCLAGGDIIVGKHQQNPRFLNYSLYCSASQIQKSKGKAKLKVVHISSANIGNVVIAVPDLNEQKKIADFLDEKCSKITKLIDMKQKKIEYLKSMKKSLIYEYVTGKKRVTL